MRIRTATLVVSLVDAAAWALVAFFALLSGSDPATRGLDQAAGMAVTALFLITGAPALMLALAGRAPATALTLALAFPALLVALFIGSLVAFAR